MSAVAASGSPHIVYVFRVWEGKHRTRTVQEESENKDARNNSRNDSVHACYRTGGDNRARSRSR